MRIAAIVALLALTGCEEKDPCTDRNGAYFMSKQFVTERLKSPTTAAFPYTSDSGVSITEAGECKFRVVSFVDAQNGFGATVRQRYSMDIEYIRDREQWRGANISIY